MQDPNQLEKAGIKEDNAPNSEAADATADQAADAIADQVGEILQGVAALTQEMPESVLEVEAVEAVVESEAAGSIPEQEPEPEFETPAEEEAQAASADAPVSDEELEAAAAKPDPAPGAEAAAKPSEPFVMEPESFLSAVEAVLFAAERPVNFTRIREAFGEPAPDDAQLQAVVDQIRARYEPSDRGFELRRAQGGYHFVTKVENAEFVRRFQAAKPFRLGRSALEVMSIVAYRQPITRAEIDQVRGIDSSHLLRTLIERGLVRMAGKAELPGRPVQYATTPKFLEMVGLASASELPPLSELTQLEGDIEDPQRRMEEGLDKFLKPMAGSAGAGQEAAEDDGTDPELEAIDSLLLTADQAPKDVYASAVHRDVALANQEALEAFQAANRRRPRKPRPDETPTKTVTFEELSH